MCYSPEADMVAGVVIGAIGIDTLAHARNDRSLVALAALPAVFATHQAIEAVTWWGLQGRVPADVGSFATTAYLVIAFSLVPILVPYAIWRTEPVRRRRSWMAWFVVLGVAVAAMLTVALATGPHSASIGGRFISYHTSTPMGDLVAVFYVFAICTPLILSSHRRLVVLGALNIPVVIGLWLLLAEGFISLWCVWAAATSIVIANHVRVAAGSPSLVESLRQTVGAVGDRRSP
jgi:hypothetical protein